MNRERALSILQSFIITATLFLESFGISFASHPLITDDTGTQGQGKMQLELNAEYSQDQQDRIQERKFDLSSIFTFGARRNLDLVLNLPYTRIQTLSSAAEQVVQGLADIPVELKWMFYQNDGLSFALKPGLILPVGNYESGLGSGEFTPHIFFIASKGAKSSAFHLNLGYIRNANRLGELENLWHTSLASELAIFDRLKVVVNAGMERQPVRDENVHPAFFLAGFIFSLSKYFYLDAGIKTGLSRSETDLAFLLGMAGGF